MLGYDPSDPCDVEVSDEPETPDTLMAALAKIQESMEPYLARQRALEDCFVPILRRQLESMGITFGGLFGGNCPVQIEGVTQEGYAVYFRARGEHWRFHVAPSEGEIMNHNEFWYEGDYGEEEFEAGFMPMHQALLYMIFALKRFRAFARGRENPFD